MSLTDILNFLIIFIINTIFKYLVFFFLYLI